MAVTVGDEEKTLQDELSLPILLAERVRKAAEEAESSRSEWLVIDKQVEKLSIMLRTAVRLVAGASSPAQPLYNRPIRRIAADVSKTLDRALTLVRKCRRTGILKHVFTITSAADFRKVSILLENSIGDMRWLLSIYESDGGFNLALPPIASGNDPMLAWVWSSITALQVGRQLKDRIEAANHLASLARDDNERNKNMIVEEGAVGLLLRLLKDSGGTEESQIAALNALFCLVDGREGARVVAKELGIPVIVQVLKDSAMKVQIAAVELVAKIAEVDPMTREEFGKENVLKPLLSCLMMDLVLDDYKKQLQGGTASIHSIVQNQMYNRDLALRNSMNHNYHKVQSSSSFSDGSSRGGHRGKEREDESPEVKHELKTKCALALRRLCEESLLISRKISEPKWLFCLSKIIETEKGELQLNCLMTIMEIAEVAETDVDLRKAAWKPSSAPAKAVLDQLLRVIKEESKPDFLVPVIKAIGCLSRIFPARETRVVSPLVAQLGNMNMNVASEAAIALEKFVSENNYNRVEHSKAIIEFQGVPPIMKMMMADERAKLHGIVLLCHLSVNVGNSKELEEVRPLFAVGGVARSVVAQKPELKELFSKAIHHLTIYQPGAHPHSHSYAIV